MNHAPNKTVVSGAIPNKYIKLYPVAKKARVRKTLVLPHSAYEGDNVEIRLALPPPPSMEMKKVLL